MRKTIYLHVGLHKTGSTSIQKFLAASESNLAECGIYYPILEMGGKEFKNHSVPLYSAFSLRPTQYHMNIKLGFVADVDTHNQSTLRQLENILNTDSDVVLSGEAVSSLNREELADLESFLQQFNKELEVICFVRRPYSFYLSALQELIKEGRGDLSSLEVPHFYRRLHALKDVFGRINFISFEHACKHPRGPVGVFSELIGCSDLVTSLPSQENTGIGNLSTRLYAHINQSFPLIVNGKLNTLRTGLKVKRFDQAKFLLTQKELKQVKPDLDFVNQRISSLLGNDYIDSNYPTSDKLVINRVQKDDILAAFCGSTELEAVAKSFVNKHIKTSMVSKIKEHIHKKLYRL